MNKISPGRPRTRFLSRHILPSDTHSFIGRVWDLSIVALHFDSYDELARHSDCKYVYDVASVLKTHVRRVESLNIVGGMLWPEPVPVDFKAFPISRHEWLTVASDAFLMRLISIADCVLLLTNEVHEAGLDLRRCSVDRLRKAGVPKATVSLLEDLQSAHGKLRTERNARVHHGVERGFTTDDMTFRTASMFEQKLNGMTGHDRNGRRINLDRSFKEGLVELQRDFNSATRALVQHLDRLYDALWIEFEARFTPRFAVGPFGPDGPRRDLTTAAQTGAPSSV